MRKLMHFLICISVLLGHVSQVSADSYIRNRHDDVCGSYHYHILEDGTAEITQYLFTEEHVIIPDSLDGFSVTRIGRESFMLDGEFEYNYPGSHISPVSIVIPETVTYISTNAFSIKNLISISIPDSVTGIGSLAFLECESLDHVRIPDSVTEIGYGAFTDCSSLSDITLPNKLNEIQGFTFAGCTSLTELTVPRSVVSISDDAFEGSCIQFLWVYPDSAAEQFCINHNIPYAYPGSISPPITTASPVEISVVNTPVPETRAEITEDDIVSGQLIAFLQYWYVNNLDGMLDLCSPSWKSVHENPKKALFSVLKNRTPLYYEIKEIQGIADTHLRQIDLKCLMDMHNNKGIYLWSFAIVMEEENSIWYVNPMSLENEEHRELFLDLSDDRNPEV